MYTNRTEKGKMNITNSIYYFQNVMIYHDLYKKVKLWQLD